MGAVGMCAGEDRSRQVASGETPVVPSERSTGSYDGADAAALAARWGAPVVVALAETRSTLDDAHRLAMLGAPHGSVVLADHQTGGRGRQGRAWSSAAGCGIWLTLVAREPDPASVQVLAIRLGLAAAGALDGPAGTRVALKWPNDLYLGSRKLGGVLVEARWQGGRVAWLAAGIGINVRPPASVPTAAGLPGAPPRLGLLDLLVPSLLDALGARGMLRAPELAAFAVRDLAAGRRAVAPLAGTVVGIASDGALVVRTGEGQRLAHAGSLLLDPPLTGAPQRASDP